MAGLVVKIDHIATLREMNNTGTPEPISAGLLAEIAGADGIAVHLREDRRYIQDRDLRLLRRVIQTQLNLYMPSTSEMVGIALDVRPDLVILVPEGNDETAQENGIDLVVHRKDIAETVATLQNNSIRVSIQVKPDPEQVKLAHQISANRVELHAAAFCNATSSMVRQQSFSDLVNAAKLAQKLRLGVDVGNGLCYKTIKAFRNLDEVDIFSIGHSIIARAVLVGMERAVKDMMDLIHRL